MTKFSMNNKYVFSMNNDNAYVSIAKWVKFMSICITVIVSNFDSQLFLKNTNGVTLKCVHRGSVPFVYNSRIQKTPI